MKPEEIKKALDDQAKVVKEARDLVEKGNANSAESKEKLEKMKADFVEAEKANKELVAKFDAQIEAQEEQKKEIELLKKQNARFAEGDAGKNLEVKEAKESFGRFLKESPNENRTYTFTDVDKKYLRTDLAASGGVLVPEPLFNELLKQEIEISPILANARLINATVKSMNVGIRTTVPTTRTSGEGGSSSSSQSAYKSIRLEAHRYDIITPITREELKFSQFNMETEMTSDAAISLSQKINLDMVSGDGVSKSEGFMTNANVGSLQSALSGNIALDDFYTIQKKDNIKGIYRNNGKFYMNANTLFDLATRVAGDGHYIWQQNGAQGLPNTIAGKPYADTPDMPDVGSSTYPVVFGDMKKGYYILNAVGVEVVIDPYSSKANAIIEYQWIQYIGGKVALAEALVKLQCGA